MTNLQITFPEFVRARHALWLDKTYGIPTANFVPAEITDQLRPFHLTNVWRELDRGTLTVINDLQRNTVDTADAVFHTVLYRFFNSLTGYQRYLDTVKDLATPTVAEIQSVLEQPGNFSGAYLRTVNRQLAVRALQELPDHAVKIAELIKLYSNGPGYDVRNLEDIREAFGQIPSFGNFLADQLMLDFSWQGNPWLFTFNPELGPGAKRGLTRANISMEEAVEQGQEALDDMPAPYLTEQRSIGCSLRFTIEFGWVETEHQLCEVEKLWKFQEAAEEGLGRKVKMRNYGTTSRAKAKPVVEPLPYNWQM